MLAGLRTVVFAVADLPAARDWYASLLDQAPTFDQPFYVGFDVGGFDLGLTPASDEGRLPGAGGDVAYWGMAESPWPRRRPRSSPCGPRRPA